LLQTQTTSEKQKYKNFIFVKIRKPIGQTLKNLSIGIHNFVV